MSLKTSPPASLQPVKDLLCCHFKSEAQALAFESVTALLKGGLKSLGKIEETSSPRLATSFHDPRGILDMSKAVPLSPGVLYCSSKAMRFFRSCKNCQLMLLEVMDLFIVVATWPNSKECWKSLQYSSMFFLEKAFLERSHFHACSNY